MKEIQTIVKAYNSIDFSANSAALATVVRVEGSSYRRTGARMLVMDNGAYLGGISGGCLEGDALRRAQKAIASNKPSVVTYDTMQQDDYQIGVGLGCNGIIDVLFTPLQVRDPANPVNLLSKLTNARSQQILISVTDSPKSMNDLGKTWIYENATEFLQSFSIKGIADQLLQDIQLCSDIQTSKTIAYDTANGIVKIFIEVILPVIHLIIYGANNDIYPMVRIANELGWDVSVVTNIAKADRSLLSLATRVFSKKEAENPVIDNYSAIILMAHDYKTDFHNLQAALETHSGYIGLLGPRKRGQKILDGLQAGGKTISEENLLRIFAPAGLDIGANTPEEIALSIIAEIKSHFAGRAGTSLRLRKGAIHGN